MLFLNYMFKITLRDTQTGLKIMKKKSTSFIYSQLTIDRYAFDVEFLNLAVKSKLNILEIPITINMSSVDINLLSIINVVIDLIRIYRNTVQHKYIYRI